ncbi:diacylglycerol kinase family protein [Sphingobacterium sp. R2]|uniref:diacylglycerol kinase family protein n=1 Tax=Sphingobacterium sp. R2 TaxID=3112958 RepID=UPI00345DDB0F
MAKDSFSFSARLKSFRYAFNGLKTAWQEEHNFRVHSVAAVIVLIFSIILNIAVNEWIAVLFSIGFVFVCELFNTAMENIADFTCNEENPTIKKIKDVAAAAVMISSITALLVGLLIFIPKLISFIPRYVS